jgi:hypothetical protein
MLYSYTIVRPNTGLFVPYLNLTSLAGCGQLTCIANPKLIQKTDLSD